MIKRFQQRLQAWWSGQLEAFFDRSWEKRSHREKGVHGVVALAYITTREVIRDRGPMMAAGLAFFTVLAIVPLLTVAASLMTAFGLLEGDGGAVFDTLHQLFPDVASGLASYLRDVATNSAQAVGGIGAATLLIIGLVLFNYIEETLTKIWQGVDRRSVIIKMLTFWAMITFGPVLIALSIIQTAGAQIYLSDMGIDVSFLSRMMPVLYALIAFTLLIKIVPNAEVKWRSAVVGGLFTAVVFELAKWGFNLYVNQLLFQTYDRVYGTLALIPIGLIWVYITWLVILIGAELSYSFQYLQQLMRVEAGRRSTRARPSEYRSVHPIAALEVLAPILNAYERGDGPVDEQALTKVTRLPRHIVTDVVDHFVRHDVVVEVEEESESRKLIPSRPAKKMVLEEVVEPFWFAVHRRSKPAVGVLSKEYLEATRQFFEGRLGDVLLEESGDDGEAPSPEVDDDAADEEEPQPVAL